MSDPMEIPREKLPDLWRKVGADGHAAGLDDAEPMAARLAGLGSS